MNQITEMQCEVRAHRWSALTEADKAPLRAAWAAGQSVRQISLQHGVSLNAVKRACDGLPRGQCECGRQSGHKGHCFRTMRLMGGKPKGFGRSLGQRLVWSEEADEHLTRRYSAGDDLDEITVTVSAIVGYRLTASAVQAHANSLHVKRPPGHFSRLAKTRKMGRAKGSKNKRPYVRTKGSRPTKVDGLVRELLTEIVQIAAKSESPIHIVAPSPPKLLNSPSTAAPPPSIPDLVITGKPGKGTHRITPLSPAAVITLERSKAIERLTSVRVLGPALTCQTVIDPGRYGVGIKFCGVPSRVEPDGTRKYSFCTACHSRFYRRVSGFRAPPWA
jgi:hypothetical protein